MDTIPKLKKVTERMVFTCKFTFKTLMRFLSKRVSWTRLKSGNYFWSSNVVAALTALVDLEKISITLSR